MFTKVIKNFCILVGILAMFLIAAFLMLPPVLKFEIPQRIEEATGTKASLNKLALNLFSLQLGLGGFTLRDKDGNVLTAFDKLYVDMNAVDSIKESVLVIDELLLSKPLVRLVRYKDGRFNFDDLFKQENESNRIFPVKIGKLALSDGKLSWEDFRPHQPVKEDVQPINFELNDFSTVVSKQFPAHLFLVVKSIGKLDWRGEAGINPVIFSGHIKADDIDLTKIAAFAVSNNVNIDLEGKGSVELDYTVAYEGKAFDVKISKSRIQLNKFKFSEKGPSGFNATLNKSVLEGEYHIKLKDGQWQVNADKSKLDIENVLLPGIDNTKADIGISNVIVEADYQADNTGKAMNFNFSGNKLDLKNASLAESGQSQKLINISEFLVQGVDLNLDKHELAVSMAKATDGDIKAWLTANGRINYLDLFKNLKEKESITNKNNKTVPKEETPWRISVQNIELQNFDVAVEDRTQKTPVSFTADSINLKLTGYTNKAGVKIPVQFNAVIDKTGSVKLDGDFIIEPLSAQLKVVVKDIDLDRLQPYLQPYARLDLVDGKLETDGSLTAAFPSAGKTEIKFKGNTAIVDLVTRDQILGKDFVNWKKLSFNDIDIDLAEQKYLAKSLIIEKPYARVVRAKDKKFNVSDIFMLSKSKSDKSVSKEKTQTKEKNKVYFKLDRMQIIDGSSHFADFSLILPFTAQIDSLDGGASDISSGRKSTIKASLNGSAYGLAPVGIAGFFNTYEGKYNVEMNFQGLPMPLVSPYMVQFAGYKVEKGKLTLALKYKIENGYLTASDNILIDQLELGEKVENPNAVSLPLKLAVALLKDSSGKIKLNVPITGSLEDPKFSLGTVIREALVNAIEKIISSPFTALASLVGSEQNLSTISFLPGKSDLGIKQMKKLDSIAIALKKRPALILEVKGAAYQDDDWPALREKALDDKLKSLKADELYKKTGKKIRPEHVELTDDDYKRLLADQFIAKFPSLAKKSIFGKPRLIPPETGDFYAVAKEKLAGLIKPQPNRLKRLAQARAQAIAVYLVQKRGVLNDRIFILEPAVNPKRETKEITSFLSLNAR